MSTVQAKRRHFPGNPTNFESETFNFSVNKNLHEIDSRVAAANPFQSHDGDPGYSCIKHYTIHYKNLNAVVEFASYT